MTTLALPRVRVKHRRRKIRPPSNRFWWVIGNFTWDLSFCIYFVILVIVNSENQTHNKVFAAIMAFCAGYWWPKVLKEWKLWRDENDEDD